MTGVYKYFEPCTANKYYESFSSLASRISELQLRLMQAQYSALDQTVTAPQLARATGLAHYATVNRPYGSLGRSVAEFVGRTPRNQTEHHKHWWSVLSNGFNSSVGFKWVMHSEVSQALEKIGWVEQTVLALPEEVKEAHTFAEGATRQIWVNAYERSSEARRACIEHFGAQCYVCGFNFLEVYGPAGRGIIHVHHERPLASIGERYQVDPITDLKPVCPNCHAMIHQTRPVRTIAEIKALLEH